MKKQKKNFLSWLILSWMIVLLLGFQVPEAMATVPTKAYKGALPIPGTNQTKEYLNREQHGVLLKNGPTTLIWEENGDLKLYFFDEEVYWSSGTGGKGTLLVFQASDGKFFIQDLNGAVVWSAGVNGGETLSLLFNRNLILQNSSQQTIWSTQTAIPSFETGKAIKLEQSDERNPFEFMIPENTTSKYLYLEAEGADGGKREIHETNGNIRFIVNGGSGATVKAWFEIGTAANQLPPKTIFRIFAAKKGATRTVQTTAGCAGGAATSILCKRPNDPNWYLLMVSGGGGGAYSDCCTVKFAGHSAVATEDGGDSEGEGGRNGGDGEATTSFSGGNSGNGLFGSNCPWRIYVGEDEITGKEDPTILPTRKYLPSGYIKNDGFPGADVHRTGTDGGNGGSGYSGGGPGRKYRGGGGGGSFLTRQFAMHDAQIIENPSTSDTQNGFVVYKLTNSAGSTTKMFKLASATNKCVTNAGGNFDNGNNIQLFDCKPEARSQYWVFDDHNIRLAYNTRKCMDVENHQTANATNVRIWDCMDHNEQRWIYDGLTKQFRSFLDLNKCLNDAYGGNTANGTNIMLWDCHDNGGKADQWDVSDAYTISDPTAIHYFVPVKASGLALQSADGAQSGSNVQLGTKNTNDISERWVFDGKYIKYSPSRDLCLTVQGGDTSNGTNILLRGCSDSNAKKWIYNGMTQQLHSALDPGKCIEVATTGGEFEKGMNIQLMDCNQHSRQKFDIK